METKSSKTTGKKKPQERIEHPEEHRRDLNPDHLAGHNIGTLASRQERGVHTAYDVKEVHRSLAERFADDDLKQVPVLPAGTRLRQGGTYIDLAEERPREFTATGDMQAEEGHAYVPKEGVPYIVWNRLIGDPKPGQ